MSSIHHLLLGGIADNLLIHALLLRIQQCLLLLLLNLLLFMDEAGLLEGRGCGRNPKQLLGRGLLLELERRTLEHALPAT